MQAEIIFKVMADGTRQRTLGVLRRYELSVSELVDVLNQPQSTVSRHLKILRDAELVRDRRDGKTVLYSLRTPTGDGVGSQLLSRLFEWVAEQPLAATIEFRLDGVIRRRGDMSRRFFDRIGRQWDALREESFGSGFQLEAFLALLPQDWTVADIGTGTGYLLPALARHFRRVVGVEPVDSMLEAARRRLEYHGIDNVALRSGELAKLPLEDAAVDLAIAVLVLHHVPAPRDALTELHRVVRAGGRVMVVEQTAHQNEEFRDRMQDRWWGFDPRESEALLEYVGFADVRSRRLATVEPAADAPDLFVVSGRKGERSTPSQPKVRVR